MMRRMFAPLRRLGLARDGGATIELAIIAPVLATLVIGIGELAGMIISYQRMHDGVSSGAVYLMRGGSTSSAIHDVAMAAWPNKPGDAAVTVSQSCQCAGVAGSCSSVAPTAPIPRPTPPSPPPAPTRG